MILFLFFLNHKNFIIFIVKRKSCYVIKKLYLNNYKEELPTIDYTSQNGYLDVVKYLYRVSKCHRKRLDTDASRNGYLEIGT